MKRDHKLLKKRAKRIGIFFWLKKHQGLSSKRAIIDISQIMGVSIHTVNNDLTKYRKGIQAE